MESIKERIMQHILTALGTINKQNGYSVDIQSIQRYRHTGLNLVTVPLLHVREGDDLVLREKKCFPLVHRQLEVYVSYIDRPDQTETRSGDEILTAAGADIEKALLADPTRGGLALFTENPDWMEAVVSDDEPHLAQAFRFLIDYRHHQKDPAIQ